MKCRLITVTRINYLKINAKLNPVLMLEGFLDSLTMSSYERLREILATITTPTTGEGVIPQHEYTRGEKYETQ